MKKLSPEQQARYTAEAMARAAKRSQATVESLKHSYSHILATFENLYPDKKDKLIFFMRYPEENFYYVFGTKALVIMEVQKISILIIGIAKLIKPETFTYLVHVGRLIDICKELEGLGYFVHIADQDQNNWKVWGPPTASHETINTTIGAYEFNKN